MENLIDSKELAEKLGVMPDTLKKWRKKKGMPFIKIGRSVRYETESILKWLEQNKRI